MADPNKKPKGWLIAGIVFLLLGLGGCGIAAAGVASFAGLADDIADTTDFGQPTQFTSASDAGALVLLTSEATCVGADGSGADIEFTEPGGNITVDANGENFDAALTFDTVDGESYELICGDPTGATTGTYTVLKLPSILGSAAGAIALGGGVIGGFLFLFLGVIFIIVGLVQRSRWKKNHQGMGPQGGMPQGPMGNQPVPPPPGGATPPPPGAAPSMTPPPPSFTPPPMSTPPPPSNTPPPMSPPPPPEQNG